MRNITARLKTLLHMLLGAVRPVSVNDLASELRISRRTVFRELANSEPILQSYGLGIGTKPGEGIFIEGDARGRDGLRKTLHKMAGNEPADRFERQMRLILTLLHDTKLQKLSQYAERFGVSVPTISNDLDEIEGWLANHRLTLIRKTGSGISVSGGEMAFRRALLGVLHEWPQAAQDSGSPFSSGIAREIDRLDAAAPFSDWMTPNSKAAFQAYLAVAAQRIASGRELENSDTFPGCRPLADRIGDFLADRFAIAVGEAERDAVALELAACALNLPVRDRGTVEYSNLLRLSHQLIDGFDSRLAPMLKLDEALLDGLVSYLQSAIIRLRHRVELRDPLSDQMSAGYAEAMEKTRRTAQLLAKSGDWLPEDEISLLATHFGAAVSRLSDQMRRGKDVRVGVVCIHGMGTSYLLASQARKIFGGEAKFEVGCWNDFQGWQQFDFLISTTPILEANMPVVVVPLVLTDESVRLIRGEIEKLTSRKIPSIRLKRGDTFLDQCRRLEKLSADAGRLFSDFLVLEIDAGTDFAGLADMAGTRFADGAEEARIVRDGLMAREAISSQVIEGLRLVLLHCRTDGVTRPRFGLIVPAGGVFAHPYFRRAKSCIVMLLPENSPPEHVDMIGCISAALINDELFLADVQNGRGEEVRLHLENIVGRFLLQYISQKLDGGG